MALGSQSGQQVGRNRYMYRRRRGRSGRWIGVLAVLLGAAVVVWYLLPGPQSTQATNTTATSEPVAMPTPTPTTSTPATSRAERASQLLGGAASGSGSMAPEETPQPEQTRSVASEPVTASDPKSESITKPVTPTSVTTPSPERPGTIGSSNRIVTLEELARTNPIEARRQFTDLLTSGTLGSEEATRVRGALTRLGEVLLLDPSVIPQDPFVGKYVVQSGDSLSRIRRNANVSAEWMMIKRINRLANPNAIRTGQSLKVPIGTFHAVVSKSDYVMDLFIENEHGRVVVASFPVGLGEYDATPTGRFVVRENSKLVNPQWRNPRTGEFFYSDDPENPIGERWIGIKGIDPTNEELLGYGIHGTIEPDSIGRMESMGCIRMHDADVKLVYDALTERGSTIEINP